MHLLYPADPLQPKRVDDTYAEEFRIAKDAGLGISIFSFEDFLDGRLRIRPEIPAGETVFYRGWMFTPAQYGELHVQVAAQGAAMLTSPPQYARCHHLPGWYSSLVELTPETVFFQETDDLAGALRLRGWTGCFLKDHVKSLSATGGSMVQDLAILPEVIAKMKMYRGEIEGGLCARRLEDFDQESEDRYFVFGGKAYAREDGIPEIVLTASRRIDSPFFSVDTIRRRDGIMRIVELGDGQVSDGKKWRPEQIIDILRGAIADRQENP